MNGVKNFYFIMPQELWQRLRNEAERTGDNVSEIIRKASDAYLAEREGKFSMRNVENVEKVE